MNDDAAGLRNKESVRAARVPLLRRHLVQLELELGLGALVVQSAFLGLDVAVMRGKVLYELNVLELFVMLFADLDAVRPDRLEGACLDQRHRILDVIVGDEFPLLLLGQGKDVVVRVKRKDRDDCRQSDGRESDAENGDARRLHGRDLAVRGEAAVNEEGGAGDRERQGVAKHLGHHDADEFQNGEDVELLKDELEDLQQASHDHHEGKDDERHDEGHKNGIENIEIQDPHAESLAENEAQKGPLLFLFVSH